MPFHLSFSTHRNAEAVIVAALVAFPVVLNFRLDAFAVSVALGVLAGTLAFAMTREGRSLGGTTHRAVDGVLVGLLAIAAIGFGASGEWEPASFFALVAAAQWALMLLTRYAEHDHGARSGVG